MWILLVFRCVFASYVDLPKLNSNISETTISGFSSGAYMSVQMHYAFSEYIRGAAIFAGGPYTCTRGELGRAMEACSSGPVDVNVANLIEATDQLSSQKLISDTSYLKNAPVYIFSGVSDTTVLPEIVHDTQQAYQHYGASMTTKFDLDAGHCVPTLNSPQGGECAQPTSWECNCGYAGVDTAMNWILGSLNPGTAANLDNLIEFDQTKYFKGGSFQPNGYAYVPSACQNGSAACRVHIVFHGCTMGTSNIGMSYVQNAGYNELAEANNLVILYPQIKLSNENPVNTEGCWDFWGYNDIDGELPLKYATQEGVQIRAVWKMVEYMTLPDEQCDTYTCSNTTHQVPKTACWIKNTGPDNDSYYVTPCSDDNKPICPMPPFSTSEGLCEAIQATPEQIVVPGEYCDFEVYFCNGTCVNGICTGAGSGQSCGFTLDCSPGYYCSQGKCTKQVSLGGICTEDYNCENNYFCSQEKKCTMYASIKNKQSCQKNKECESFFCATADKKCYDPPKSASTIPVKCTSAPSACTSETWNLVDGSKSSVVADCACGYNPTGDKYCALNPGDNYYKMHSSIMKAWLTSSAIKNCNTEHRESERCLQTHMDDSVYEQRLYYFDSLQYFYRYVNVETCVGHALFASYYEEEDELDDSDEIDDSDDDFSAVIGAVLALTIF